MSAALLSVCSVLCVSTSIFQVAQRNPEVIHSSSNQDFNDKKKSTGDVKEVNEFVFIALHIDFKSKRLVSLWTTHILENSNKGK